MYPLGKSSHVYESEPGQGYVSNSFEVNGKGDASVEDTSPEVRHPCSTLLLSTILQYELSVTNMCDIAANGLFVIVILFVYFCSLQTGCG